MHFYHSFQITATPEVSDQSLSWIQGGSSPKSKVGANSGAQRFTISTEDDEYEEDSDQDLTNSNQTCRQCVQTDFVISAIL